LRYNLGIVLLNAKEYIKTPDFDEKSGVFLTFAVLFRAAFLRFGSLLGQSGRKVLFF